MQGNCCGGSPGREFKAVLVSSAAMTNTTGGVADPCPGCWKSETRLPAGLVSGDVPLGLQTAVLPPRSHVAFPWYVHLERESELSGVTSYKDTNPLASGPTLVTSSDFNYLLGDPTSKRSCTGD